MSIVKTVVVRFNPRHNDQYQLIAQVLGDQESLCRTTRDAQIFVNGIAIGMQALRQACRVVWAPGTKEVL